MTPPRLRRRWSRGRSPQGLRRRVALAVGGVALLLGVTSAAAVWIAVSHHLLAEREAATAAEAARQAAALVRDLTTPGLAVADALAGAARTGGTGALVHHDGRWFSTSIGLDRADLPAELRDTVLAGIGARQRVEIDGALRQVVGVALPQGGYFAVFPLDDLQHARRVLAAALVGAAALLPLLGLVLGRWAARPALRPLDAVTAAVADVARGRLSRRVDPAGDPDLAPLAAHFNATAAAFEGRVRRDARFAADVSHELRTPLATIRGSVELVRAGAGELSPAAAEALDLLDAETRRFEGLVADLLEVSRLDAGDRGLVLAKVRPAELVERSLPPTLRDRLTVGPGAGDLALCTDKRRLSRIVANLVENAERHGGGLTALTVETGDRAVRLVVDDCGPGLDLDRDAAFAPFARGARARAEPGGTGLGLALVERHVTVLGGHVDAAVSPCGGARFVVVLPRGGPPCPA